jgi:hypothetical protein
MLAAAALVSAPIMILCSCQRCAADQTENRGRNQ